MEHMEQTIERGTQSRYMIVIRITNQEQTFCNDSCTIGPSGAFESNSIGSANKKSAHAMVNSPVQWVVVHIQSESKRSSPVAWVGRW